MMILLRVGVLCLFVFGAKGAKNDGSEVAEDQVEWIRDGSCTAFPEEPAPSHDLTSWDARIFLWKWKAEHQEASAADLGWDLSPSWNSRIEEALSWMTCREYQKVPDEFEFVDGVYSHYQEIDVYYSEEEDDVCLLLDNWLHTCASLRPHYHEVFVHYPARFLDEVKRVIYFGGGDSMMLHEILKYPSLELAVGLELDQFVTREVFKDFGIQPNWNNEKVHWWYGDAAKTLMLIPREYYGSFDLVIVDITTEVTQSLMVNHELNIIDAAMLLMKPGGIIAKNEDDPYIPGTTSNYTDYSVELIYHGVPKYCLQSVVVGSNTVDFLTAKPKDHNIETLYLKGVNDFQTQFDSWYNFGVESSRSITGCKQRHNETFTAPDEEIESLGVLMVLEAENTMASLGSSTTVKRSITQALNNVGLFVSSAMSFPISGDIEGFTLVLLFPEGYIVARCFALLQYCAFDIQLWGAGIPTLELVKAELVGAVQSQRPSSFRVVTGGVPGVQNVEKEKLGPPTARELCNSKTDGDRKTHSATNVRRERRAEDFGRPQASTLHAYNLTSSLAQWQSQRPVGVQALMQFEVPPLSVDEKVPIEDELSIFLSKSLQMIKGSEPITLTEVSEAIGDGLMIALSWSEGSVIATWDGSSRVELNLFLAFEDDDLPSEAFEEVQSEELEHWELTRREDFPRGVGSVVNFKKDIGSFPVWAKDPDSSKT